MFAAMVSVLLLVPATEPPKQKELSDAAKKELTKLQGKWQAEKVNAGGTEETPPESAGRLEFKGRKILLAGKTLAEVADLDPSTKPKCLDFKVVMQKGELQAGTVYESVYKLDGDTLTWAVYIGAGSKRPANFDPPTEAGFVLVVLKRVKE